MLKLEYPAAGGDIGGGGIEKEFVLCCIVGRVVLPPIEPFAHDAELLFAVLAQLIDEGGTGGIVIVFMAGAIEPEIARAGCRGCEKGLEGVRAAKALFSD